MKRTITSIFAIMLALVMVLSLAACGGSGNDNNSDKKDDVNLKEYIIGKWEYTYTAENDDDYRNNPDYSAGDRITSIYEFSEGGVYKVNNNNETRGDSFLNNHGEWVIEDGVLKLSEVNLNNINFERKNVFKIDTENGTMTKTDDEKVVYHKK